MTLKEKNYNNFYFEEQMYDISLAYKHLMPFFGLLSENL